MDTWYYVFKLKRYDDNDRIVHNCGMLSAVDIKEAFANIADYYGQDSIIDITISAKDVEGFVEFNNDTIKEFKTILNWAESFNSINCVESI